MYKNLKAEMVRQDVTFEKIAELIKKKPDSVMRKVNGLMRMSIDECREIATLFKENNSLDYLFQKAADAPTKERSTACDRTSHQKFSTKPRKNQLNREK